MKLNRFQAFGFHLVGSLVAAFFSSALVFLVWYRWPLSVATGVTEIFVLLLAVDVVIGPCITLIVFNTAKKELKRDLAMILLLQICAFLYGLHAVFVARPVYLVFNADRFDLVYANDLSEEKLRKVVDPQFRSVPLLGTEVTAARAPDSGKARNEILFSAVAGGDDLPQLPQYYVRYAQLKGEVQKHIHPLQELKSFNYEQTAAIDALGSKYASIQDGIGFVPLRGKVKDLTVIVRRDSAEVLEVKDLRPWKG
ncbi:MAG: hypothetical protein NVSMB28_03660 [Collimonas sp.]